MTDNLRDVSHWPEAGFISLDKDTCLVDYGPGLADDALAPRLDRARDYHREAAIVWKNPAPFVSETVDRWTQEITRITADLALGVMRERERRLARALGIYVSMGQAVEVINAYGHVVRVTLGVDTRVPLADQQIPPMGTE